MERLETEHSPEQVIQGEWDRIVKPLINSGDLNVAEYFLDQTYRAYGEEGRFHHTLNHIADCVTKLVPYREREDYLQLFLALLWHDVVYDIQSQTNEEDSAAWAAGMVDVLGLPGSDKVSRIIIATKSHLAEQEDEALVCGIDLSILAAPEPIYAEYAENTRHEYTYEVYTDEQYNMGRKAFLESMLKHEQIFVYPDFEHMNESAKTNMRNELELLAA